MFFTECHSGGFWLTTDYGVTYFRNRQKFYKFQVLCQHPSKYVYVDGEVEEDMCERCGAKLAERPLVDLDSWADDGGRVS